MPQFTTYYIEATTTVIITTQDGKSVADFTVHANGFADSDTHSLEAAVNNTAEAVLSPVSHYAAAAQRSEKERLTD